MRLGLCSCTAVLLCGVALAPPGYGDLRVVQYTAPEVYNDGLHFDVSWNHDYLPTIRILQASDSQLGPYDFDCYDTGTDYPYDSYDIAAIVGTANIGDVEITIRGHEGRAFGAHHVDRLDFSQGGVNGIVGQFEIDGSLGWYGDDTHISVATGTFIVGDGMWSDMYVSSIPEGASYQIWGIAYGRELHVAGAIAGTLQMGGPGG
jgi:hypothetical protein